MEEWKVVPSLPQYEASSLGRIRRIPHEKPMPRGGDRKYGGKPWYGVWEPERERFIFQFKGKTYKVARVVCEAFNGPAPPDKPYCLHDDEDSRNNKPDNLKWGTQKENLNYPGFLAYCRTRTGDKSPYRKGKT